MNEKRDLPGDDAGSDEAWPDRSASVDRFATRLAELRGQLELLAPQDQERGRQAIERVRQAQERIATLEATLGAAREREDELTAQLISAQAQITEYGARISELSAIATRVSEAEEARRRSDVVAADSDRALTLAKAEVKAQRAETERLRTRCSELEADLSEVADQVAAASVARVEAARLERERNEARERAQTERRLAASDRLRAAEADLRASGLQSRLRAAERRIAQLAKGARDEEPKAPPEHAATVRPDPPWIELQRATSVASTSVSPESEGPAAPASMPPAVPPSPSASDSGHALDPAPWAEGNDVIDLTTEHEDPAEGDSAERATARRHVPAGWTGPSGATVLGRFWRGLRRDDATDEDRTGPADR